MTHSDFDKWLTAYGAAWETRNPDAATSLFAPNAQYFWNPLDKPQTGHAEIADAWHGATSKQRDISFEYDILSVTEDRGIAHWRCTLTRIATGKTVHLDGVLVAEFDSDGSCQLFREWWHSDEVT